MVQVILNLEIDEILRAFTTGAKNEGFRLLLQKGLNAMLERESSEQLGAKRYERTEERTDSRNGVRTRELKTRIGRLTLNVPRHRNQPFRTMLFENYSRSEQALLTTMTTMVLEGVSTRKIARITEELCGSRFPTLPRQRCQFHFARNIAAKAPAEYQAGLSSELTEMFSCGTIGEARKKRDQNLSDYKDAAESAMLYLDEKFESVMTVMALPAGLMRLCGTSSHILKSSIGN